MSGVSDVAATLATRFLVITRVMSGVVLVAAILATRRLSVPDVAVASGVNDVAAMLADRFRFTLAVISGVRELVSMLATRFLVSGPTAAGPKNSASRISEHRFTLAPESLPQKSIGRSCWGCFIGATLYPWMIFPVARTVPVEVVPVNWINIRHEEFGISGRPRPAQSAVKRALANGL